MRTVTLEILRHGPPHNQLLSPLTRYLALCGNHPAETVEVPYEHEEFLRRLRDLRYRESDAGREMTLTHVGRELSEIFSRIPGLIRELGEHSGDNSEMTHLRLVLNAQELALLPLELIISPNGFPGAGQPLALQTESPVCITREVRRVSKDPIQWPRNPKILFVAAAPPDVDAVPIKPHLLVLRHVIEPWVYYENEEERRQAIAKRLTVLPHASAKTIQQAAQSGEYTHVHILAHGVPKPGDRRRYGLALHDSSDPSRMDVVEGDRLATLLRTQQQGSCRLCRPAVVTVASCDSGNVGSVVGAGASVAHALHEAGIPLVVASQFPLSFAGSILMTQVLFEGLLRGGDPRCLIDELRRRLKARIPDTHDWAAIVAYASFPDDLERQLFEVAVQHPVSSIQALLARASRKIEDMSERSSSQQSTERRMEFNPFERATAAKNRLEALLDGEDDPKRCARIYGQIATTAKQLAEMRWRLEKARTGVRGSRLPAEVRNTVRAGLNEACAYYDKAFATDRSQAWGLVQAIVLDCVLQPDEELNEDRWNLARLLSEQDIDRGEDQIRVYAHGNLMELNLLKWIRSDPGLEREAAEKHALHHAKSLLKISDREAFEIASTRRQVVRYLEFFNEFADWRDVELAEKLLKVFPTPL